MVLNFGRNVIDEERNISAQTEGRKVKGQGQRSMTLVYNANFCP